MHITMFIARGRVVEKRGNRFNVFFSGVPMIDMLVA